ncbi:hypothetical protein ACFWJ5_38630 [Streptomyces qaidamensis]|uniref:hypothetical protein n=1 Tax=Streptomyces qaidamensis TaxID=1783515 RepID=UPI0036689E8C
MANEANPEPEVLHHRGVLTPFQEWHNEPRCGEVPKVPRMPPPGAGLTVDLDRFKGRARAAQVVRQQSREFCETVTPGQGATCGLGVPKPVVIIFG